MPHTLAEAAKAASRDRSTLLRAIRSGKLSAVRDPANGAWLIEPAELHRVYRVRTVQSNAQGAKRRNTQVHISETVHLEREIEMLRERLTEKDEALHDLRRRLDLSDEERRRLTAVLADQRPAAAPLAPVAPAPARRSWTWKFWRARTD